MAADPDQARLHLFTTIRPQRAPPPLISPPTRSEKGRPNRPGAKKIEQVILMEAKAALWYSQASATSRQTGGLAQQNGRRTSWSNGQTPLQRVDPMRSGSSFFYPTIPASLAYPNNYFII